MRAFSVLVLRRDPFCQYPGCDRRSEHAHHRYPRSTHPELKYRWHLGAGVCAMHHRLIHDLPEVAHKLGLLKWSWESPPDEDDEERGAVDRTDLGQADVRKETARNTPPESVYDTGQRRPLPGGDAA